jgi:Cytochrome C oxidase subunit II, transmembrane domain
MKYLIKYLTPTFLDSPTSWQFWFQDPATPICGGGPHFHNHLLFFFIIVGTFVVWLLFRGLTLYKKEKVLKATKTKKFHYATPKGFDETWAYVPAFFLLTLCPTLLDLFFPMDEVIPITTHFHGTGHQWGGGLEHGFPPVIVDMGDPSTSWVFEQNSNIISIDSGDSSSEGLPSDDDDPYKGNNKPFVDEEPVQEPQKKKIRPDGPRGPSNLREGVNVDSSGHETDVSAIEGLARPATPEPTPRISADQVSAARGATPASPTDAPAAMPESEAFSEHRQRLRNPYSELDKLSLSDKLNLEKDK